MRAVRQRDCLHLGCRCHLEIQRDGDRIHDRADIGIADVAAILTQMRGDTIGTGGLRHDGRAHRIGHGAPARIAQCRDVIDIHTEPEALCHSRVLLATRGAT